MNRGFNDMIQVHQKHLLTFHFTVRRSFDVRYVFIWIFRIAKMPATVFMTVFHRLCWLCKSILAISFIRVILVLSFSGAAPEIGSRYRYWNLRCCVIFIRVCYTYFLIGSAIFDRIRLISFPSFKTYVVAMQRGILKIIEGLAYLSLDLTNLWFKEKISKTFSWECPIK
jgi:hypothetical protein